MPPSTALSVHPALARLARLHERPTISLGDIGMSSMGELVETFEQIDEAIRLGEAESVRKLLAKLEGGGQIPFNLT